MEQGKPIHVSVDEALFGAPTEIGYPQEVASIQEDSNFPVPGPIGVWFRRWYRQPNHDCAYAWENEPCECQKTGLTRIPRYDLDWSATGPLIERFAIQIFPGQAPNSRGEHRWTWGAEYYGPADADSPDDHDGAECREPGCCGNAFPRSHADTPLLAICNLILALSAAGKLPK